MVYDDVQCTMYNVQHPGEEDGGEHEKSTPTQPLLPFWVVVFFSSFLFPQERLTNI